MPVCRELMQQTIKETPGVYCIEFDPINRNILWRYDEKELPNGTLPDAKLKQQIADNLRQCGLQSGGDPRMCDSCRLQAMGQHRCSRLRQLAEEGMITVFPDDSCPGEDTCLDLSTKLEHIDVERDAGRAGQAAGKVGEPAAEDAEAADVPAAAGTTAGGAAAATAERSAPPSRLERRWTVFKQWLRSLPREPIAVGITFVAMITGLIVESVDGTGIASRILFLVAYLFGGYFGLRAGIASLKERKIDIDLLMILAALGAAVVGSPFEGALLLFLFSLSNVLQDYAMDRTRNAIRSLMKLRPARADVERDGERMVVPVDSVAVGEIFFVKPGDRVPLDGIILTGEAGMDESLLTGESRPVRKGPQDTILAGSINTNGSLKVQVTKASADSTIAKIIRLVEDAQSKKAKTERFLDTFEQYYAGFVILMTIAFAAVPVLFLGEAFDTAFYRAITIMVAASPCALIISTPASVLSAIGAGAKQGILFKGGVYVEQAGTLKAIAFDKTGTLTYGKPEVTDVVPLVEGLSEDQVVNLAAAVEQHSEHALAQATVAAHKNGWGNEDDEATGADGAHGAKGPEAAGAAGAGAAERAGDGPSAAAERATNGANGAPAEAGTATGPAERATAAEAARSTLDESVAFEAVAGKGVEATVQGRRIRIGAPAFFNEVQIENREAAEQQIHRLRQEEKTVVAVTEMTGEEAGTYLGIIGFADRLRENAADVIAELKSQGISRIIMLTGDNDETAQAIAREAGVDEVYSELTPDAKLKAIEELESRYGTVAMVGDGVNDAPSLARASLGVAMGAGGTDVALETADVVLMADQLEQVPFLVELSRRTRRTLMFNLGLAIGLILLMIGGILLYELPLPLAVVGHEGGTVLVSLNGLRLLFHKRRR